MKIFKLLCAFSMMCLIASTSLFGAEAEWLTNYKEALEKAKKENKKLLIDFTGSDWCGWCIKLNKEVFSTDEFKEYAAQKLVLLEIDFPRDKEQSEELKKQNEELQEKYKIEGFPTIIVLDKEGKKIGELGYMEGGPKNFINAVEELH